MTEQPEHQLAETPQAPAATDEALELTVDASLLAGATLVLSGPATLHFGEQPHPIA